MSQRVDGMQIGKSLPADRLCQNEFEPVKPPWPTATGATACRPYGCEVAGYRLAMPTTSLATLVASVWFRDLSC